jgi:hypothetical protein
MKAWTRLGWMVLVDKPERGRRNRLLTIIYNKEW